MRKRLLLFGCCTLIVVIIIWALDYSGKVAKENRYKKYETEQESVISILRNDDWSKNLISNNESMKLSFRKEWIPVDEQHDIDINQDIETVGNTTITVTKTYRDFFQGNDTVTVMVHLNQDTKKLRGSFLYHSTFDNGWYTIPAKLTFYHNNNPIEVESYSLGTGDSITVGLPYYLLEQYDFNIDVNYEGLALYEYEYIGI